MWGASLDRRPRSGTPRAAVVAVVALAVLGLSITIFLVLPGWVVHHDLAGAHIEATDRLNAVNAVRTTLLQAVGGAVVLFGAYATWRQVRVSQDGLHATREGQVTDRFSRAVDQLGSDKLDVRIGGLYALWRIADHSVRDREAVISIMAAYLRTHLPWPPQEPSAPAADVSINAVRPLETRAADAQVALTGLGVLVEDRHPDWLNVSLTDLRRADCDGLWLTGVNLDGACLEAASMYQVNLSGASMIATNLRHVELTRSNLRQVRCLEADLRGARLVMADLSEADFSRSELREANLGKAIAAGAVFVGADLRAADLRGCDLSGANLREARLDGALASDRTIWPAGFDVRAGGIVIADDPAPGADNPLPAAALTRDVPPLQSA